MKSRILISLLMLMSVLSIHAAWDGTSASSFAGGDGSQSSPYEIATCEQLAYFAQQVNAGISDNWSRGKYFRLTADIVFNDNVTATALATLEKGTAFTICPVIGEYTNETTYKAFQGNFDGAGHSISGLYYYDSGNAMTFFKAIDGAVIKNLHIKDSYIYAGNTLGFICGAAYDSQILNCQVTGSIIDSWASTNGAIAGFTARKTTIQNCYASITLKVKNCSGGICGKASNNISGMENDVLIENCYTACTFTLSKSDKKAGIGYYLYGNCTMKDCWYGGQADCVYGNNSWDEGKSTVDNCNATTDLAATIAALNEKASSIEGACQWNADGTLDYSTIPASGGDDVDDVNSRATDPAPADGDLHYEADGSTVYLSWTAAADGKTVKQYIYIGTDRDEVDAMTSPTATLSTSTSYTMRNADITTTYYWRVDRERADGKVSKGDIWRFRPAHLAFPGAEGYGRLAHGGRGGEVVYVTNLNDSGEGSLRWALTNGSGPRTVMFNVSGIIDMGFQACHVDDYVTIAGQSAPGKGILVMHSDIGVGSDNICRFLRARRGMGTVTYGPNPYQTGNPTMYYQAETGNALGMASGCNYSITDHLSLAWGSDETFSSRTSKNITFQRSMISEALGMAYHRNYSE